MLSLFFWKNWDRESRYIYLFVAVVFAFSVVFMLWNLILGADSILNWESFVQSHTTEIPIDTVKEYPFSSIVNADAIVFTEYFGGSAIQINTVAYYIFLIVITIAFCLLLAISTYLPRFWYLVTTGLFLVVLILMKLDLLLLFDSTSKIGLIISIGIYLPTSYYYQSFNKDASFLQRIVVFTGITALFGLLIYLFSGVASPFMQLSVFAFTPALMIALLFVILVSHDIIAGFLNAVTSGGINSAGNWKHFFIISGIYLLNVLLLYLKEVRIIEWELLPLNVFILLLISALIGIWGYKQREAQYDYLIPFYPLGAVFYLSIASVATITVGYFYATGNDAVLDVIGDIIIFSHLGYGLVFIMYVVSNFLKMMTRNLPIYRILYSPDVMPYFTFRFAGLIAFGALLFLENWEIPFQKSVAGYYNGLGDLHAENGEFLLANGYYEEASLYGRSDHRSNYSLAQNAMITEDFSKAVSFYKRSNYSWPTEYSYANLSNLYFAQGRFFEALFEVRNGLKKFPESGPLMNNMGMLYSKLKVYDSAYYYLNKALAVSESSEEAKNNLIALVADGPIDLENIDQWRIEGNAINLTNYHAVNSKWREAPKFPIQVKELEQNQFSHAYIYNYLINTLFGEDTTAHAQVRDVTSENIFFARRKLLAFALSDYYKGDVGKAIDNMKGLRGGDRLWTGKVDQILGQWHLQNGDLKSAVEYFKQAKDNYNSKGLLSYAMALTLDGQAGNAILQWDSLRKSNDPPVAEMAEKVSRILSIENPAEIYELNDSDKYQWLTFHPTLVKEDLIESFSDPNYQAMAILSRSKTLLKSGNVVASWEQMTQLDSLSISNDQLKVTIAQFYMEVAAAIGNTAYLASLLDAGFLPDEPTKLEYYQALLATARGDSTAAARLYDEFSTKNPFNEGMVIASSRFFESRGEKERAYLILQEASSANQSSLKLQKAYIGICGRMGYESFGYYVLDIIKSRLSPRDYNSLLLQFQRDIYDFQNIGIF